MSETETKKEIPMIEICCATCPAWRTDIPGSPSGRCTLSPPKWTTDPVPGDYQPGVALDDVCSHHPLHPMQRDRIALEVIAGILAALPSEPGTVHLPFGPALAGGFAVQAHEVADAILVERQRAAEARSSGDKE